jgi:hypothetical protein
MNTATKDLLTQKGYDLDACIKHIPAQYLESTEITACILEQIEQERYIYLYSTSMEPLRVTQGMLLQTCNLRTYDEYEDLGGHHFYPLCITLKRMIEMEKRIALIEGDPNPYKLLEILLREGVNLKGCTGHGETGYTISVNDGNGLPTLDGYYVGTPTSIALEDFLGSLRRHHNDLITRVKSGTLIPTARADYMLEEGEVYE